MWRSMLLLLQNSVIHIFLTQACDAWVADHRDGCTHVAKSFPNQVFYPDSSEYLSEIHHFWSETCIQNATCTFIPKNTQDIAKALEIFVATNTTFAVRGNGHTPNKGAASIEDGVLVGLDHLNTTTISDDLSIATVGPGLRWAEVYEWLEPYNRTVLGGRYATVGVSGLLLGGGMSHFASQYGWAANMVINYELVTANGSVLLVNQSSQPDLFWALKGGANNYGIVTRFDLKTIPLPRAIYGGSITYNMSQVPAFITALSQYLTYGGGVDDTKAAIDPALFVQPSQGLIQANAEVFYDGAINLPTAFANFTKLPMASNTAKIRNYTGFVQETASFGAENYRESFHSISFRPTEQAVQLIKTVIVDRGMKQLSGVKDCFLGLSYQPVSQAYLQNARKSGGDAIDLDPSIGTFIAFNLNMRWSSASDDIKMAQFADQSLDILKNASKALDLYVPFVFLNDAAASQDPFTLYGGGKSLPRMRQTRRVWDPNGVFQTLLPGGFKLGF